MANTQSERRTGLRLLAAAACVAALALLVLRPGERAVAVAAGPTDAGVEPLEIRPPGMGGARESALPALDAGPALAPTIATAATVIVGVVLGVDDVPLAGAACSLSAGSPSGGFGTGERDAAKIAAASSDVQGRFRFEVGAGPWRLDVRAPGHGPWHADHLRPGDEVEVRLAPAGFVLVHAVDEAGAALADVELSVRAGFRGAFGEADAAARSDPAGLARLGPLAPGTWYVSALHPERRRAHREFELSSGSSSVEVELMLERGLHLRVEVAPAEGATPLLEPVVRVEAFSLGQSVVLEPAAGPDGRFETPAILAPGEVVTVAARARGLAEVQRTLAMDPALCEDGVREVRLELGGLERVVLGRAVDAEGLPLAGVEVRVVAIPALARGRASLETALARVTPHPERWRAVARTGADGRFAIRELAPDTQAVVALLAGGFAPAFAWPPDGEAGATHDLGDVALPQEGRVHGVARFGDGEPVAGVQVRAQPEIILPASAFDTWRPSSWWRPATVRTDERGSFRIDGLTAGEHELFVEGRPAGSFRVVAGHPTGPLALTVERPDGPAVERAAIGGVVRDGDGEPVASVFVGLHVVGAADDAQPLAMTFTDVLGRFELAAPLGPALLLRASDPHARFLTRARDLGTLEGPAEIDLSLESDLGGREPLQGIVLSPRGEPLAGAEVLLEPPENHWCGCIAIRAVSDADGMVTFARVGDRDHTVRVRDPSGLYRERVLVGLGPGGWFEAVLEP